MRDDEQGISNRETAQEEREERREFPPVTPDAPPVEEDAAGRVGEQPLEDRNSRQTSHKAGSRSIAQKEAESKYPDRSHPASHKVAGADGREPS
jgi:cell division septation protein DedD